MNSENHWEAVRQYFPHLILKVSLKSRVHLGHRLIRRSQSKTRSTLKKKSCYHKTSKTIKEIDMRRDKFSQNIICKRLNFQALFTPIIEQSKAFLKNQKSRVKAAKTAGVIEVLRYLVFLVLKNAEWVKWDLLVVKESYECYRILWG